MRRFIFASHGELAQGMKHTASFLTGRDDIEALCCYLDGDCEPVEDKISKVLNTFDPQDEVVVLCDLFGGSVYQKFYPYMNERFHVICGMNLPLVMNLMLLPDDELLSLQKVDEMIESSREGMVHVNGCHAQESEDDE